jgi:sugar lactone lactonase YvrE
VLSRLNPDGTLTSLADIAGYEAANNPDGGLLDSNPFGLTAYAGGFLVADAGANALLNVTAGGAISTLSVFPNRPNPLLPFGPPTYQAVPTAVAVGPDGAFYVSQLTGFPFPPGQARVFRVPAGGGAPTEFLSGFTNIVDLAFGVDGSLYVLEIDADSLIRGGSNGALIRVAPDGVRTTLVSQGLFRPTALALGSDGAIYISNNGISPGGGQVVRVAAIPEPGTLALAATGLLPIAGAAVVRKRRRST